MTMIESDPRARQLLSFLRFAAVVAIGRRAVPPDGLIVEDHARQSSRATPLQGWQTHRRDVAYGQM
jgi:hypothetical protein